MENISDEEILSWTNKEDGCTSLNSSETLFDKSSVGFVKNTYIGKIIYKTHCERWRGRTIGIIEKYWLWKNTEYTYYKRCYIKYINKAPYTENPHCWIVRGVHMWHKLNNTTFNYKPVSYTHLNHTLNSQIRLLSLFMMYCTSTTMSIKVRYSYNSKLHILY